MKIVSSTNRRGRRGTILPMLGVCLIGLFGFVALAVDLGMLAVSRTQSQNGADVAALVGTRTLNNKDGVAFGNLPAAVNAVTSTTTTNPHLSRNFTGTQISRIEAGQYLYDPSSQRFRVTNLTTVGGTAGGSSSVSPTGGSWTAMRITLSVSQPTYFLRLFGVTTMPSGASATAVYRPRDIAFVLDMTGSMGYSSQFNTSSINSSTTRSLNPDPLAPAFGHYVDVQSKLVATDNLASSTGEAFPQNNYTIATPAGPPIVRNFYFDRGNASNPATPVTSISTKTVNGVITADLLNAFHRWSPPESGGDSSDYVAVTYDFNGYNAMHNGTESPPKGPTPAPDTFKSMTDGVAAYVGDRYRRANGGINKTNASWASNSATTRAAVHALELLGYTVSASNVVQKETIGGNVGNSPTVDNFRDPVWERWGYDLDVVKYRAWKTVSNLGNPALDTAYLAHLLGGNGNESNILLPTADRFKGYSMGPGYWGKTFYVWPPDPRPANDWRLKFFNQTSGADLDPQSGSQSVNRTLLSTGSLTMNVASGGTMNFGIDYPKVLAWIKSGPQVLPPNLRAGHVLYYSSIPDDVSGAGAATEIGRDKMFWKSYIDYVMATTAKGSYSNLYGIGDSWSAATSRLSANAPATWTGPSTLPWTGNGGDGSPNVRKPYMPYNDSPTRPRLHLWFGPLSMMDFLGTGGDRSGYNWVPGTSYEAHCWQLKAGMNSVLDDVKNNHPNDNVGMAMFAANFTTPRVPMGQDYVTLKNALFYPQPLLSSLAVKTPTVASVRAEYRPYSDSFGVKAITDLPNSQGSTDPQTGLALAYNLLASSSQTSTSTYGTTKGRRGASKIVIFETDGVPNTQRTITPVNSGYDSYYTLSGSASQKSNNDSTTISQTYAVVQRIVKAQATSTSGDSGLSLPNAPAKVYAIGFGDLFDPTIAPGAGTPRTQANAFLARVSEYGGTGPALVNTLSADQIITGTYDNRIATMRSCLERIFQSGVSVVLIE